MGNLLVKQYAAKILNNAGIAINGTAPWDIHVRDESMYAQALRGGSLGLADAYIAGKWDVDSIDQFFERIILSDAINVKGLADIAITVRDFFINSQAGKRAFHVGQKHYDLGNDMYELMLGESMGYSCGIYLDKRDTLEDAQYNKFDAICKSLELKPGMKVLEIGAGWGTLARHMATNYGVEVVGLTVSKEQKRFAENRCKDLPVKFVLVDYQKLTNKYDAMFDRVVSVEMIEAVGLKNLKTYFSTIERVLKEDGLFGMQVIVGNGKIDTFISTRIFPNGLTPSFAQMAAASDGILRLKKWYSFGTDYDKTLLAWEENFRKNWKKISKLKDADGNTIYDDKFYRMWRYYLLCCAASFRVGMNDDAQVIMSKLNTKSVLK